MQTNDFQIAIALVAKGHQRKNTSVKDGRVIWEFDNDTLEDVTKFHDDKLMVSALSLFAAQKVLKTQLYHYRNQYEAQN